MNYRCCSDNDRGARHVPAGHLGSMYGDTSGSPRGRGHGTHRGLDSGQSSDGRRSAVVHCRAVPPIARERFVFHSNISTVLG